MEQHDTSNDLIWLDETQWTKVFAILTRYRQRSMMEERKQIDALIEGILAQRTIEFELED